MVDAKALLEGIRQDLQTVTEELLRHQVHLRSAGNDDVYLETH